MKKIAWDESIEIGFGVSFATLPPIIIIIIIILFAQKQYSMPIKSNSSIKTMSKTHQDRISAYGSVSDKPGS